MTLSQTNLVSVVVTTRNEERNIQTCLQSIKEQTWSQIEVIVIDNQSSDKTKELALKFTPNVFDKGPERSAQRNYGLIKKSHGKYGMFIDADMILTPRLIEECVKALHDHGVAALHIEEIVMGDSCLGKIRRFERQFYSGTVVDGIRFFRIDDFVRVGGFDETLPPGPEDWDLDLRMKELGTLKLLASTGVPTGWSLSGFVSERGPDHKSDFVGIYHNESRQNVKTYLKKKIYYSSSMTPYVEKWRGNKTVEKQLSPMYRFVSVFIENGKWRKVLRHPLLFTGVFVLRLFVGVAFVVTRSGRTTTT